MNHQLLDFPNIIFEDNTYFKMFSMELNIAEQFRPENIFNIPETEDYESFFELRIQDLLLKIDIIVHGASISITVILQYR